MWFAPYKDHGTHFLFQILLWNYELVQALYSTKDCNTYLAIYEMYSGVILNRRSNRPAQSRRPLDLYLHGCHRGYGTYICCVTCNYFRPNHEVENYCREHDRLEQCSLTSSTMIADDVNRPCSNLSFCLASNVPTTQSPVIPSQHRAILENSWEANLPSIARRPRCYALILIKDNHHRQADQRPRRNRR